MPIPESIKDKIFSRCKFLAIQYILVLCRDAVKQEASLHVLHRNIEGTATLVSVLFDSISILVLYIIYVLFYAQATFLN